MKLTTLGALTACILFASTSFATNVDFDGTTDGGWTLVNELTGFGAHVQVNAVDNHDGTGHDGIEFIDGTQGVAYYAAPASLISSDLTGTTLSFEYEVVGGAFQQPILNLDDIYVNGTAITGLDVIDHTIVDQMQSVTLDFSDPAFNGVDLTNVTSLFIRAEWYIDNVNGGNTESFLLSAVPEPSSASLILTSLLGVLGFIRKRGN